MTDGLGKSFPARFMNVGGERTEASAMMTQILLSPIFRASDFTVNVKNSLPRFNLHQKISLLWKCLIRSEEIDSHWRASGVPAILLLTGLHELKEPLNIHFSGCRQFEAISRPLQSGDPR